MSTLAESLAGRTVLVTGSDGFIGSHVVEGLIGLGARVKAFALYNSFGSLGWLDSSEVFAAAVESGQAEFVLGDIRDAEHVSAAVEGVDVVLHLAALIAIPYSYVAPRSYVDTNVTGTLNVLEAVRRHGTPRLVHTSTSEVYGTPQTVPITEEHALRGQSPYSATKIAADKLAESYALSFDTPVTILRPFNTFGPRQSARAVIPTVLAQLLAGAEELRLGSITPQRDFTFVTDTALGFARAAVADVTPGTTVQLGTGRTVSIGEVVDIARRITGSSAKVVVEDERVRPAGSEVEILLSDPSLAKELIGWTPQVDLETGLELTRDWIAENVDLATAHRYHR
ncbi:MULTISPECIES: GDP-mannose 4,6-dehydratase [unclassified Nocardioides]|uniref:GDP-mannose 4,6-dehydratase n=1 Tax=unclassified Nocardioides TaxID=2615069 RepID=UPI000701263D|nr:MULTISPECIES: GDP-mannose 4,6-dehydratase [unclassified Nocardioides]KQY50247.1 NAD-dependent dehydratase [Nocardioides sp. Root140]KQZ75872.1 NAD-dependent dehydratase [Nocardioides sp. Root151]